MVYRILLLVLALGLTPPSFSGEREQIAEATKFFQEFERLGRDFSPKLVDLYADHARIQNKRRYPGGKVRDITVSGAEYKKLIFIALPVARSRGDLDTYSHTKFKVEARGVRIETTRYSHTKKYSSPLMMLVVPNAHGGLQIIEEYSESQP